MTTQAIEKEIDNLKSEIRSISAQGLRLFGVVSDNEVLLDMVEKFQKYVYRRQFIVTTYHSCWSNVVRLGERLLSILMVLIVKDCKWRGVELTYSVTKYGYKHYKMPIEIWNSWHTSSIIWSTSKFVRTRSQTGVTRKKVSCVRRLLITIPCEYNRRKPPVLSASLFAFFAMTAFSAIRETYDFFASFASVTICGSYKQRIVAVRYNPTNAYEAWRI